MKKYIQSVILLVVLSAMVCSCSTAPLASVGHRLKSCSEAEADRILVLNWSIPEVGISQTNRLGFRWTESKDLLLGRCALGGITQDWHGSGMVGWSVSPLVSTNGVRLSLDCKWRDSKVSGNRKTSFFIPLDEEVTGEQEGFVLKTKWIQKKLQNNKRVCTTP